MSETSSEPCIDKAAEHFSYEVDMMVKAALRYASLVEENDDDETARNAYVECALLHARNLIEFFAKRPDSDNLHPSDFGLEWDRNAWGALDTSWKPLNKHLSHLTRSRFDPLSPKVPKTIVRDILHACSTFLARLEAIDASGAHKVREAIERAQASAALVYRVVESESFDGFTTTSPSHITISVWLDPLGLDLESDP